MKNITFNEFFKIYNADEHIILDIRTDTKFLDSHVLDAINLSKGDVISKAHSLLDKKKQIYVYCNSGNSSKLITNILSNLGYDAFNLEGGFSEYISSKLNKNEH
ncbi:MAG: rhodanese-like domain-containing protein [Malacoplasma sp.]